nr:MAG TPA_asm: hypothetical protein [Caudoviricetes sp.]
MNVGTVSPKQPFSLYISFIFTEYPSRPDMVSFGMNSISETSLPVFLRSSAIFLVIRAAISASALRSSSSCFMHSLLFHTQAYIIIDYFPKRRSGIIIPDSS